jgi:hypothetical protein
MQAMKKTKTTTSLFIRTPKTDVERFDAAPSFSEANILMARITESGTDRNDVVVGLAPTTASRDAAASSTSIA